MIARHELLSAPHDPLPVCDLSEVRRVPVPKVRAYEPVDEPLSEAMYDYLESLGYGHGMEPTETLADWLGSESDPS